MLYQEENPGVEFEYSMPSGSIKETPQGGEGYMWTTGPWGDCSTSCGGGQKTRTVMCTLGATKEIVAEGLCDANEKPLDSEPCNEDPCEVSLGPIGNDFILTLVIAGYWLQLVTVLYSIFSIRKLCF